MSISGTDPELNSIGNSEGWTSTSPLSIAWWLRLPIRDETTGLVFEGEVLDLRWTYVGWLIHSLGGSFGLSLWRAFEWFVFLPIFGGSNFGPQMMQESALCPIFPHHSQILFCLVQRAAITGCRDAVPLLMKDEGLKWWELWLEVFNFIGSPIISI